MNRIVALKLILRLIYILNSFFRKYIRLKDIFITVLMVILKILKWLILLVLNWSMLQLSLFILLVLLPWVVKRRISKIIIYLKFFALMFIIIWHRALSHLWFYLSYSLLDLILRKWIVFISKLALLIIEKRFLDVMGSHVGS